ncbi:benzoate/H(+) symporter BenE family transporter [Leucobacter tardus]|uniref:benzoate/H(+) symporter BenE family transporter n=1 Tax=Leucobacter tardus TaxID=501483 RepID=UPI0027DCFDE5|nr:benzoate/H(+) symporter BenE family transporter [Leucobacter tardus]
MHANEVGAGFVTTAVGFTASFAVVLTGLQAVGASATQSASGLGALCLVVGLGGLVLSLRYRVPVSLAWSTPGAAVLAGSGGLPGGFSDAVGAFMICGALFVLTGLWPFLGRLMSRIPAGIAQAMLAGVLIPLCLVPIEAAVSSPAVILPVALVWLLGVRFWARWAVPVAFGAALVVIGIAFATGAADAAEIRWAPSLALVLPTFSWQAVLGLALPLYIVTMASQNVSGAAVLQSFGYTAPWRPALITTGIGSATAALFGGHAINLAAISAALAAGPDSGVPFARRWRSAAWAGGFYVPLAVGAAAVSTVALAAPGGLIPAVAGLALIGTLASAVQSAWAHTADRVACALTLLVAASGITVWGIGAAFWALLLGLVTRGVLRSGRPATGV